MTGKKINKSNVKVTIPPQDKHVVTLAGRLKHQTTFIALRLKDGGRADALAWKTNFSGGEVLAV